MFVQVIEGRVSDAAALRARLDTWMAELRDGATGWLGTTAGVTDDGHGIAFARFDSAESAKANSGRPEQGEWWAATESCFDGGVTFSDSDDVDEFMGGGSDDAGFVQVMKGTASKDDLHQLDAAFESVAGDFRPDVLGGIRAWTGGDSYVDCTYFTSEAEARANESKPPPPELQSQMADFERLMSDVEYLDLKDPWLF